MKTKLYLWVIWWLFMICASRDYKSRLICCLMMIAHIILISLIELFHFVDYIKKRDQDLHWKNEEQKLLQLKEKYGTNNQGWKS